MSSPLFCLLLSLPTPKERNLIFAHFATTPHCSLFAVHCSLYKNQSPDVCPHHSVMIKRRDAFVLAYARLGFLFDDGPVRRHTPKVIIQAFSAYLSLEARLVLSTMSSRSSDIAR
jgi:hypothetical protein